MRFLVFFICFLPLVIQAKVTMTWFGTASYLLSDGKTKILFDPFITRPPLSDIIFHRELKPNVDLIKKTIHKHNMRKLDAIIVTHSHYDHVLDAPEFAKRTGAIIMGSKTTIFMGAGRGVAKKQLKHISVGDVLKIGDFTLDFRAVKHTSHLFGTVFWDGKLDKPLKKKANFSNYLMGQNYALIIHHPEGTIFTHATPGIDFGNWKFTKAFDVLVTYLLPINSDVKTLSKNVINPINAKKVIPIHWDDFFAPIDSKRAFNFEKRIEFKAREKLSKYNLIIPKPEEEIILLPIKK